MKKMIIIMSLFCSPMASAALPHTMHVTYQLNDEKAGVHNQDAQNEEGMCEQEDAFGDFINNEDVPSDMITPTQPVSPSEAYLKAIGIQIFMKYIAAKIWLEHQLQSWTKAA